MIKTLLKLAIVALVANAAWQAINAYWPHYKFVEAVRSTIQYRGDRTDSQLRARILELAGNYDVPLNSGDLTVQRQQQRSIVDASYVRPVDLVPGYTFSWPFALHVDATAIDQSEPAGSGPK